MDWYSSFILEIIFLMVFGIKVEVQIDLDEMFFKKVREFFCFFFILCIVGCLLIFKIFLCVVMCLRGSMGYFGQIVMEMIY